MNVVQTVKSPRMAWVDALKAVALLWIVLNHIVERIFGSEFIGNPSPSWPPLGQRIAQLYPLIGHGIWDAPLNALRYLGWLGDQGVGLFLLASGFGLTWGLLRKHGLTEFDLVAYYRRRAGRIYPLWWGAHVLFAFTWLITGWGIAFTHKSVLLSMLGIRFTPGLFYYFSSAWWFIGLLIQLYLVFPLLWNALRRFGPMPVFIVSALVAIGARAVGLLFFHNYMDEWERGAFFVTRLPEFVAGMSLAALFFQDFNAVRSRLRSPLALLSAAAVYFAGTALSITLLGNAVAPLMETVGAFAIIFALLPRSLEGPSSDDRRSSNPLLWIGKHSYSLYLVHQPLIWLLLPTGMLALGASRAAINVIVALLATVVVAIALEWAVSATQATLAGWYRASGTSGAALRAAAVCIAAWALLAGAELLIERNWPQEAYGWGERASLVPDAVFGWRLKPSSRTRLRWESYDYVVSANGLGFPGPAFPERRSKNDFRILTVGDAFTSAEGVDTDKSWPRLLGEELRKKIPDRDVQVMNFGITGYGPNQYAAVIDRFVPRFHPDLVIIGFFVNDYGDVLRSNQKFQSSIGFDLPHLPAWKRVLLMFQLRRLVQVHVIAPLGETFLGIPSPQGYALGNFAFFERNRRDLIDQAPSFVERRLAQISRTDERSGAHTLIAMIPAPIQVCAPAELAYFPRSLNVNDATRFDMDRPQRTTRAIAEKLKIPVVDLRAVLDAAETCPYQPQNMHWTAEGHRIVAGYLADELVADRALTRRLAARR